MKRIIAGLAAVTRTAFSVSAEEYRVTVRTSALHPALHEVAFGKSVVFANFGRPAHVATAKGGTFATGRIRSGEGIRVRIMDIGTLDNVCAYRPSMRDRIVAT